MDKMYSFTSAPSAAAVMCSLLPEETEEYWKYKEYEYKCALQSYLMLNLAKALTHNNESVSAPVVILSITLWYRLKGYSHYCGSISMSCWSLLSSRWQQCALGSINISIRFNKHGMSDHILIWSHSMFLPWVCVWSWSVRGVGFLFWKEKTPWNKETNTFSLISKLLNHFQTMTEERACKDWDQKQNWAYVDFAAGSRNVSMVVSVCFSIIICPSKWLLWIQAKPQSVFSLTEKLFRAHFYIYCRRASHTQISFGIEYHFKVLCNVMFTLFFLIACRQSIARSWFPSWVIGQF